MLIRLLRQFLRPYRRQLSAVVALQFCAAAAVVYLPHLYANIINDGVARGNIGYILTTGALMLAISLAQTGCSVAATYFGAQAAMAYGRDLRGAIFGGLGNRRIIRVHLLHGLLQGCHVVDHRKTSSGDSRVDDAPPSPSPVGAASRCMAVESCSIWSKGLAI